MTIFPALPRRMLTPESSAGFLFDFSSRILLAALPRGAGLKDDLFSALPSISSEFSPCSPSESPAASMSGGCAKSSTFLTVPVTLAAPGGGPGPASKTGELFEPGCGCSSISNGDAGELALAAEHCTLLADRDRVLNADRGRRPVGDEVVFDFSLGSDARDTFSRSDVTAPATCSVNRTSGDAATASTSGYTTSLFTVHGSSNNDSACAVAIPAVLPSKSWSISTRFFLVSRASSSACGGAPSFGSGSAAAGRRLKGLSKILSRETRLSIGDGSARGAPPNRAFCTTSEAPLPGVSSSSKIGTETGAPLGSLIVNVATSPASSCSQWGSVGGGAKRRSLARNVRFTSRRHAPPRSAFSSFSTVSSSLTRFSSPRFSWLLCSSTTTFGDTSTFGVKSRTRHRTCGEPFSGDNVTSRPVESVQVVGNNRFPPANRYPSPNAGGTLDLLLLLLRAAQT
mmetsp:Transcript_18302/g.45719  ORF Transcript_18302/g.45719 Transcript_18302/m.45719 type:complete len:455 (-) Transcript_18302:2610-3974(-)